MNDDDLSPVPLTPELLEAWSKEAFRPPEPGEMVDLEDDPEYRAETEAWLRLGRESWQTWLRTEAELDD